MGDPTPLVVDVDGTLLRTDLLFESALHLLRRAPWRLLSLPLWLMKGKAYMKRRIAEESDLDVALLPVDDALLEWLGRQREGGRPMYLASASDRKYVEALADHLEGFSGAFASDGERNLSGVNKARALEAAFGTGGFDYIGDAKVDIPVWRAARRAFAVRPGPRLTSSVRRAGIDLAAVPADPASRWRLALALRPQHWLKNLLVFVPLVVAHEQDPASWVLAGFVFAAFCALASATYIVNDLLDLHSDRSHPRKRRRPFAAGDARLSDGIVAAVALLVVAAGLGARAGAGVLAFLCVYLVATVVYSLFLKRVALADILVLAGLYTVRMLAGALAVGISVSHWLLAFSMFIFLTLAIVKRNAELFGMASGRPIGRGYQVTDLPLLTTLGAAALHSTVLVLALYLNGEQVRELYTHPAYLWGICILLWFWLSRMMLLAHRGQMHDDPLVFAVTDWTSLSTAAACAALFWLSIG